MRAEGLRLIEGGLGYDRLLAWIKTQALKPFKGITMRHTRREVMRRTIQEYTRLDKLLARLTPGDWALPVPRSESKDPWTVKDAVAHVTHWKADAARSARGEPVPPEERGLGINAGNRLVYRRWHDRTPAEVLAWHRQVHQETLAALKAAPDKWFNGRERRAEWPNDLTGHSADHRVRDIEQALAAKAKGKASPR
jgi:hypothetical protein